MKIIPSEFNPMHLNSSILKIDSFWRISVANMWCHPSYYSPSQWSSTAAGPKPNYTKTSTKNFLPLLRLPVITPLRSWRYLELKWCETRNTLGFSCNACASEGQMAPAELLRWPTRGSRINAIFMSFYFLRRIKRHYSNGKSMSNWDGGRIHSLDLLRILSQG